MKWFLLRLDFLHARTVDDGDEICDSEPGVYAHIAILCRILSGFDGRFHRVELDCPLCCKKQPPNGTLVLLFVFS